LKLTEAKHEEIEEKCVFIHMKPMSDRPKNGPEVEKDPNKIHIVLTGWKGQYNVKHNRYFKIPYSSHSSYKELKVFIKFLRPKNLIYNLRLLMENDKCVNAMGELMSFTEMGKDIGIQKVASQQKLCFAPSRVAEHNLKQIIEGPVSS
jgi:hypothetical protein